MSAHTEFSECTDGDTVIGCVSQRHCQGCDQCQATTHERVAIRRDDGRTDDVRWCDECAAIVAAGMHDAYRGEPDAEAAR